MPEPRWIEEGWRSFREEVLAKGWPESPELSLVLELAFFGGAEFTMTVLADKGATPETLAAIEAELAAHLAKIKRMAAELKK